MGQGIEYVDLREVPNEVIIAAYNEAADCFTASELRLAESENSEPIKMFKTIIDPYFYGKMEIKAREIESEAKDKLYALHLSSLASSSTMDKAKEILKIRQEKLDEICQLRYVKQMFLHAVGEWQEEIKDQKEYYLKGGPLMKAVDDLENEFYSAIIVSKGSALVCNVEDCTEFSTEPDKKFTHPCIDGFVAYTDYDHKTLVDNLIDELYSMKKISEEVSEKE